MRPAAGAEPATLAGATGLWRHLHGRHDARPADSSNDGVTSLPGRTPMFRPQPWESVRRCAAPLIDAEEATLVSWSKLQLDRMLPDRVQRRNAIPAIPDR